MEHQYFDKTEIYDIIINTIGNKNITINTDLSKILDPFDLLNTLIKLEEIFNIVIQDYDIMDLPDNYKVSDIMNLLDKYGIHNNLYFKIKNIKEIINGRK